MEENLARLKCLMLGTEFVLQPTTHILDGILDLVQRQLEKARVSQKKGNEQIDDVSKKWLPIYHSMT